LALAQEKTSGVSVTSSIHFSGRCKTDRPFFLADFLVAADFISRSLPGGGSQGDEKKDRTLPRAEKERVMRKHLNWLWSMMFDASVRSSRPGLRKARAAKLDCEALEERALMSFGGVVASLPTVIYVPPAPPASFTSFQAIDASHDD
jgi:hypothetical protein